MSSAEPIRAGSSGSLADAAGILRLVRRFERERRIRLQAETIAEDATRRLYDLTEALERSHAELETAYQAQSDFIAIASHELQTPATPIIGFAQTLVQRWEQTSDEQKLECVRAIDRQAQRLGRLMTTLLTVSRLDAGRLGAHPETMVLSACIKYAMASAGCESGEVEVRADRDLAVYADPQQVAQIFVNLLTNAIRYGRAPISIDATVDEPAAIVRVVDAGPGVAPEFRARLFERFSQPDVGRAANGTGLGLYIVRGIARAQGGDVWYERAPGGGACFAVKLPLSTKAG